MDQSAPSADTWWRSKGQGVSSPVPMGAEVLRLLCACVDDVDKLWFQRGSAHQEAVHVALRRQLSAVSSRHWAWRTEGEKYKSNSQSHINIYRILIGGAHQCLKIYRLYSELKNLYLIYSWQCTILIFSQDAGTETSVKKRQFSFAAFSETKSDFKEG